MSALWGAGALAVWLGILTALGPCSLAASLAAVSYIGRRTGQPRLVLLSGVLYTLGRVLAYTALAALLVNAVFLKESYALFLSHYLSKALGLILIVAGMFLLELIPLQFGGASLDERMQARIEKLGLFGALALGILFALAFCPTSAALFFGRLVPLSVEHRSPWMLPVLYGAGTAAPVLGLAFILAFAAHRLGSAFNKLAVFEKWARALTGIVFIGTGVWYTLIFIYGV